MLVVNAADGKLLWEMNYSQGRYNAATPMIVGDTLVFAGPTRGLTALKLATKDEKVEVEDTWRNEESSVQFNTPVIRDGMMFGLSNLNTLFCVDTTTGQTTWNQPVGDSAAAREEDAPRAEQPPRQPPQAGGGRPGGGRPGGGRPGGGRFGGGGRRGGGASGGYGTLVDAGSVIVALPASGQLIVFEPNATEFKQVASYKVAPEATYGYPILTGNRIYIKDRNSLTMWTVE
jgi:outer membrane protein assembly factor BamB